MPVIISVVGNTGSGKTTLIVKLVREFKKKGYKMTTSFELYDEPAKKILFVMEIVKKEN